MAKNFLGGWLQQVTTNKAETKISSQPLPHQLNKQVQAVAKSTEENQQEVSDALLSNATYAPQEKFSINVTKKLSPEVAILHIYAFGSDKYRVLAEIDGKSLHTQPEEQPNISLGKLVQDRERLAEIAGIIGFCSFRKPQIRQLLDWLIDLRKKLEHTGQHLYLLIADHTDFEIPWEMLKLSENEHLGTAITTARWQYICSDEKAEGRENLLLDVKPDACQGSIMSYVNRKLKAEAIDLELNILNKLNAQDYRDIKIFLETLKQNQYDLALIFIACHGDFGNDVFDMALKEDDKTRLLGLMQLYNWKLNLLKKSQSIVFINACHSGRLRKDDKYIRRQDYRTGFATYFLEQGAKGVIGTLGEVDNMCAAKIARNLIEQCHDEKCNNNLSVAELLQRIRAQAVQRVNSEDTPEAWKAFIYTFMYVYYGNPMTVLRLSPLGGQLNV
ncbi:hypothetical protein NIES4073_19750 [Kalymmatonema gypsitolerans NIES-4073]|nr:hypothetical protein NIES4073_19750 [Scytonema sp. NIES-4073]